MHLTCRDLVSTDSSVLENWICTDPARTQFSPMRGKFHPAPWELSVQSLIRTQKIMKIDRSPNQIALGVFLEEIIVGVAFIDFNHPRNAFHIGAISCNINFQNQGMSQEILAEAVHRSIEHPKFKSIETKRFYCEVDSRNTKSIRALEKFGFMFAGSASTEQSSGEGIFTYIYQA
ncbi:GNAT family protein [uncultured Rothia sp.]|uniref:GNAT family N-acetyltransferase n=1 Tax=uncultured Rothia sp. TaxID=316088 RepID=UPI00321753BA